VRAGAGGCGQQAQPIVRAVVADVCARLQKEVSVTGFTETFQNTFMPVRFKLDFSCGNVAIITRWLTALPGTAAAETPPALVESSLTQFRRLSAMAGVPVAAKAAGVALKGISVPVK